jgi:hypothetical protein
VLNIIGTSLSTTTYHGTTTPAVRPSPRTAPDHDATGWPPGIPYIVGNVGCERFSFYGLRSILLLTMGEVMVSITGLEFAYSQAPRRMKSTLVALMAPDAITFRNDRLLERVNTPRLGSNNAESKMFATKAPAFVS